MYSKSQQPLQVGSIVRYSGDNSRLRKVVEINGDNVVMESYGRWTRNTGLVPAKRKIRTTGRYGHSDFKGWDNKLYKAKSYCTISGDFSCYFLYNVTEV
jgi:hypothetical protein